MSSKPEQVLIIEPENELRFKGPFTGAPIASYMKLTNPTNHKVYFKIKTTAPKRYCVRPNSGELQPNGVCEIAVCLQPFDFDPNEKSKHKFMVQTIIAENETDDIAAPDIWKNITADKLMDTKLKCVFENPTNSNAVTKAKATTTAAKPDSSSVDGRKSVTDAVKSSPKSVDEAEEKLAKAAQEINQLRADDSSLRQENLRLKEELLRYRMSQNTAKDSSSMSGISHQSNSPLPISNINIIIAVAMAIVGYLMGKLI